MDDDLYVMASNFIQYFYVQKKDFYDDQPNEKVMNDVLKAIHKSRRDEWISVYVNKTFTLLYTNTVLAAT